MMFEGRFALAPELKTGFDKIDVFDGYWTYCYWTYEFEDIL